MKFENRGLVILLGALGIVIIGLVVGIVVAVNRQKDEGLVVDSENGDSALPEELMGDNLSAEDRVTKKTSLMLQDPDTSYEDIESYYDAVIGDAINDGDMSLARNITVQKMNFLVVLEDDCEKAREYIDNLDISFYSAEERRYLASDVISAAIECGDLDWQNQWENIYSEGM